MGQNEEAQSLTSQCELSYLMECQEKELKRIHERRQKDREQRARCQKLKRRLLRRMLQCAGAMLVGIAAAMILIPYAQSNRGSDNIGGEYLAVIAFMVWAHLGIGLLWDFRRDKPKRK